MLSQLVNKWEECKIITLIISITAWGYKGDTLIIL